VQAQEAYQELLRQVENGGAILTAGRIHPDIPIIQEVGHQEGMPLKCLSEVKHLGFGFFRGETQHGEFSFDGGGAMNQVKDGDKWLFGWTSLRASAEVLGDLGYDLDKVAQALESLIATK